MRKVRFLLPLAALLAVTFTTALEAAQKNETRNLTGHVLGSQDAPLAKAVVYLKNTKTLTVRTYIADADGSFHFPALSANVDYEVYAAFDGSRSDTKTLSAFDN